MSKVKFPPTFVLPPFFNILYVGFKNPSTTCLQRCSIDFVFNHHVVYKKAPKSISSIVVYEDALQSSV